MINKKLWSFVTKSKGTWWESREERGCWWYMEKVTGDVSLPKELMTYHLSRFWFLIAFGHKLDLICVLHTCLLSESEGFLLLLLFTVVLGLVVLVVLE